MFHISDAILSICLLSAIVLFFKIFLFTIQATILDIKSIIMITITHHSILSIYHRISFHCIQNNPDEAASIVEFPQFICFFISYKRYLIIT